MKIFVIGKLGELVKKIFELEELLQEHPENQILLAELTSYNQILEIWPVAAEDDLKIDVSIKNLKLSLDRLKREEVDLRRSYESPAMKMLACGTYISALDTVRNCIGHLNQLGKFIGDSPWMDIDDAKLEQPADNNNPSGGDS